MEYLKTIIGIFLIVNPIGIAPIFYSLTQEEEEADRKNIARLATLTSTGVLLGSALIGKSILTFFGVSIPAFRIAGGILLLLISLSMLNAQRPRTKYTKREAAEAEDRDNIAIVPIAIPIITGPGAISATVLYGAQASSFLDHLFLVAACLLVGGTIYIALILSPAMRRVLGRTGNNIISRLFGVILASLGVEFIVQGALELFPGLS